MHRYTSRKRRNVRRCLMLTVVMIKDGELDTKHNGNLRDINGNHTGIGQKMEYGRVLAWGAGFLSSSFHLELESTG